METGLRVPPVREGGGKRKDGGRTEDGCEVGEPHQLRVERTPLLEPGEMGAQAIELNWPLPESQLLA